jgi:hypothetical protein
MVSMSPLSIPLEGYSFFSFKKISCLLSFLFCRLCNGENAKRELSFFPLPARCASEPEGLKGGKLAIFWRIKDIFKMGMKFFKSSFSKTLP